MGSSAGDSERRTGRFSSLHMPPKRYFAALATALFVLAFVSASSGTLAGTTFEGNDGNLVANGGTDWANLSPAISCPPATPSGCTVDTPSGSSDNSFSSSKEDDPNVTIVQQSVPPNKNDLVRSYLGTQTISGNVFLYLAWIRTSDTGDANLDFELNQKTTTGDFTGSPSTSFTLNRTDGDLLITYDFGGSGTPDIGLLTWYDVGHGHSASDCYSSGSLPCWANRQDLTALDDAEAAVNDGTSVSDPITNQTLASGTFGEASINLSLISGVFTPGSCKAFGSEFVKSRSSGSSFNSDLKDFIAPGPIFVSNCGSPTLTTSPTSPVTIGSSISDTATLSGVKGSPAPVPAPSTVTFNIYAAADTSCATPLNATPIQTVSTDGSGVNPTYTSGTFTPSAPGSYQWVASFAGDNNNNAVVGACGDATEVSVVNKAGPTISTNAAPLTRTIVATGLDLTDMATLLGGQNPTGTITFHLYADNGSGGCGTEVTGSPVTKAVAGNGSYTSPLIHITSAGTYHWIASYGGDTNNSSVSGACGDTAENVTVNRAGPGISTNAAPLTQTIAASGLDLTDTATLTNGVTPTGTITFHLYADNGSGGCGTELAGSPVTKTVSGNGAYISPSVHVSAVGDYHWVASYGGDVNNSPVAGSCGDANENVSVVKAGPAISTDASPLAPPLVSGGLDLTDTATLSGGVNPTGTITFHLYADNGTGGCGSELAGSPVTKSVSGNGSYTSPSVHVSTAGTYHWVASYGGDANNKTVAGACGDLKEDVTVGKASPGISTDASPLTQTIVSGGLDLTDVRPSRAARTPPGRLPSTCSLTTGAADAAQSSPAAR